jgi:large conductance mechanosensitive channel
MGLISEFKTFIIKGNAIDLAVGIIIGAAFGSVVNSLVTDVIMPPVGWLMSGVNFTNFGFSLPKLPWHADNAQPVSVAYGKLIDAIIKLVIQGFAIFMVVKMINKLKRKEEAAPSAPPAPTKDQVLLTEIRDLLSRK